MRSPAQTALRKREVANGLRVAAERSQAGARRGPDSSQQPGGRGGRAFPPAALSPGDREPCSSPQPASGRAGAVWRYIASVTGCPEGWLCPLGTHPSRPPERLPCRCRSPPRSRRALRGLFSCSGLVGTAQTNLGCAACPAFLRCSLLLMRHACAVTAPAVLWVSSNGCGNLIYPCVQNVLNIGLAINRSSQTTNPNQKKGSQFISRI